MVTNKEMADKLEEGLDDYEGTMKGYRMIREVMNYLRVKPDSLREV